MVKERRAGILVNMNTYTCVDPEGGTGGPEPPPLKNYKNIGVFSNTGADPLKNHKATKPAFNVDAWRFAGGPMMTRF